MEKRKIAAIVLVACVSGVTTIVAVSMPRGIQVPANIRGILGITHVAGKYNLGNSTADFLNQGADIILDLGSRAIKLWFMNPQEKYPFNSAWPAIFTSLVDMANYSYFRDVFSKPFTSYVLVVYSIGRPEHYWTAGITHGEKDDEQQQFYNLTKHLLVTYAGTEKTFILQHWEGDWAIRGSYNASQVPTQVAIEGMVGWLDARQSGVEQARAEIGENGVHVYHAAEINLVDIAMNDNKTCVVNAVLPRVSLDLVSYSSWDTGWKGTRFKQALDYIAVNMPDSPAFGAKNVYIGEFGGAENDNPSMQVQATIRNVVETSIAWGCPYIMYWQIFCNEPKREPVTSNADCSGYWLVKPDGTHAWAWGYFQDLYARGETSSS